MSDPRPAIREFVRQAEFEKWYETVEKIALWVEERDASMNAERAVPQGDGHP